MADTAGARRFIFEIDAAALGVKEENYVDNAWNLAVYEGKPYGLTMSTRIGPQWE